MKKTHFTSIGKLFGLILISVLLSSVAKAQAPASNIKGPVIAYLSDGNITLTSEIATTVNNPTVVYSFSHNTSGASIVSQGAFVYDQSAETGTSKVIINPGSSKGNFVVNLNVTDANGTSESSKSVSVLSTNGSH